MIKHLILLNILNMMNIKEILLQFFDKKNLVEQLKMRICLIKNQQQNYTNQLLENLKKGKHAHLLQIKFGILIQLICNRQATLKKEFVFYYVLLIFSINKHGIFLSKIKKALQLLMVFNEFQKNLIAIQKKYGQIKAAKFITHQ